MCKSRQKHENIKAVCRGMMNCIELCLYLSFVSLGKQTVVNRVSGCL